MAKLWWS